MKHTLYTATGSESKQIEINESVFGITGKDQVIYDKIKNELANRRVGTASTKTRGMVSGGGRKPWKQKGTGRARAGSNRSPIWVGGGTVFGPKPRDYSYSLPKKLRKLAIAATISKKFSQGVVSIVEDFSVASGKTRDAVAILQNFRKNDNKRVLLIHSEDDMMLKRAVRNIPWLRFISSKRLMAHEIFYAKDVIIMESCLKDIESSFISIKGENNG